MALVVGCTLIESASSRALGLALVAGGLGLALAFLARQRRAAHPLVPRDAFRLRTLRLGTAGSFVNTATTSSAAVLVTLVLQEKLRETPFAAGLMLLPLSLAVVGGSTICRGLMDKLGAVNSLGIGVSGIAAGDVVLAVSYGSRSGAIAGVAVIGFGLGVASVAANHLGTAVPEQLAGTATGVINTGAQLGTALGVAVLVVVASARSYGPWPATAVAWSIAAAVALLTAIAVTITNRSAVSAPDAENEW
jgi:hypothetical protein